MKKLFQSFVAKMSDIYKQAMAELEPAPLRRSEFDSPLPPPNQQMIRLK